MKSRYYGDFSRTEADDTTLKSYHPSMKKGIRVPEPVIKVDGRHQESCYSNPPCTTPIPELSTIRSWFRYRMVGATSGKE